MRENDPLALGRVGSLRGPRNCDGTIIPETVDTMWGTDLTTTFTGEGPAVVFIAIGATWLIERHGFISPAEIPAGLASRGETSGVGLVRVGGTSDPWHSIEQ
jgi:hypothetical protein